MSMREVAVQGFECIENHLEVEVGYKRNWCGST
jgi:hypothetical protein